VAHVIVFSAVERFAGWPANNGLWRWADGEMLVGFTTGGYQVQPGHNIEPPYRSLLARSLDSGQSWQVEEPQGFVDEGEALKPLLKPLDFLAPGFALRVTGSGYHGNSEGRGGFFASTDRGRRWQGPYAFTRLGDEPELSGFELTPRTDYLVEGSQSCLLFLSARPAGEWGGDRVFCARTLDGGRTFRFVAWVVGPSDPYRAVMPSTVRLPSHRLVSAMRRRQMGTDEGWIDAYGSHDQGQNWQFLSRVGETGKDNGNPPALALLGDGRLCCVYGQRTTRQLLARFSADRGLTWSEPQVLRDDYHSLEDDADLGYPRLCQRSDGALVAIYYWACQAHPYQHIAATRWKP
jgi:hypothetical protein